MKTKFGTRISSLLLVVVIVVALAGAIFFPAVGAESITSEEPEMLESLEDVTLREELPSKEEIAGLQTFENPVKKIITELKSQNYSDKEITEELAKHGYGWYPETGACWNGTPPSEEDLKILRQTRGPDYSPFGYDSDVKESTQANRLMYFEDYFLYRGTGTGISKLLSDRIKDFFYIRDCQ